MMLRALLFVVCLSACSDKRPVSDLTSGLKPTRIISLDYCADQYVLKLADRDDILALSPEALQPHSYMRKVAKGIPSVRPLAENAIAMQPDLIVRSYGGGPGAERFFEQAGIPVLNIGWASDLETIKTVTREIATGLGQPERGKALVRDMDDRLTALLPRASQRSILYLTPTGVTTGPGSLIHALIVHAGLINYEHRPGWHSLPLEQMTQDIPDLVATSFYDTSRHSQDIWSAARHPIARRHLANQPIIELSGAWTACGAWFALDALEAMAEGTRP